MKTIGQVGYEAWARMVYSPTPTWEALPDASKEAWEKIARAVVDQYHMVELGR